MAIVNNNIITRNLSGSLGKQIVFRKCKNGKTIACKYPEKRKNQVLSESEAEVRKRFSFATAYARWAMQNDPVKASYDAKARRGRTAYKLAFRDAYNAPSISWIDTSGYKGEPKDVLRIRAMDDFKVTGVKICIYSPDSMLLEVGDAQESGNGLDWIYTVTEANPHVAGSTIHAIASDLADNISTLRVTIK